VNKDIAYLHHMLESLENVVSYTSNGKSYFLENKIVQDAVVRNFQIMGEACKKISSNTSGQYEDVPWSKIAKFRDKLAHDYFGVNYELIWGIIEKDLPKIKVELERAISALKV